MKCCVLSFFKLKTANFGNLADFALEVHTSVLQNHKGGKLDFGRAQRRGVFHPQIPIVRLPNRVPLRQVGSQMLNGGRELIKFFTPRAWGLLEVGLNRENTGDIHI